MPVGLTRFDGHPPSGVRPRAAETMVRLVRRMLGDIAAAAGIAGRRPLDDVLTRRMLDTPHY